MADEKNGKFFCVRDLPEATKKKIKLYAAEHDVTMAQAVEELVDTALSSSPQERTVSAQPLTMPPFPTTEAIAAWQEGHERRYQALLEQKLREWAEVPERGSLADFKNDPGKIERMVREHYEARMAGRIGDFRPPVMMAEQELERDGMLRLQSADVQPPKRLEPMSRQAVFDYFVQTHGLAGEQAEAVRAAIRVIEDNIEQQQQSEASRKDS